MNTFFPMFLVYLNLSVQDLGYGTVQKRYHGGAYRNSHLSTDSTSPTTSRVCLSPFYINKNIIIYTTIIILYTLFILPYYSIDCWYYCMLKLIAKIMYWELCLAG